MASLILNGLQAIEQIQKVSTELLGKVGGIISMGGDHTIALPLLRSVNHHNGGPIALVHMLVMTLDQILDTIEDMGL